MNMSAAATVTIKGVTTEYSLSGQSGPVIVLLNGFRIPMSSWEGLFPNILNHGRVLAYNRPGVGRTSKASCDQTGMEVVTSLQSMLDALRLEPPYILLAHSLGGLLANLFSRSRPHHVSAVVFVDAAHPDEKRRQEGFTAPWLVRFINDTLKSIERRFDEFKYSEDGCVDDTVRQIREAGDFPPIPVAVVTGRKKMPFVPEASFAIHLDCQGQLAALSPHSVQLFAEHSGHFPQITEPEVVIRAIEIVSTID